MSYGPITGPWTTLASENSEVSPVRFLVAVAVTNSPSETAWVEKPKEALPFLLVVTLVSPRKVLPSPKPDESA
jgi:hypothetical protein